MVNNGINIHRFRRTNGKVNSASKNANIKTPTQLFNEFLQLRKINPIKREYATPEGFRIHISIEHEGKTYETNCGPNIDKKNLSHQSSTAMLKKLSFHDDAAYECYRLIDKYSIFRVGDLMALEEGEEIEFKGGEKYNSHWEYKQAKKVMQHSDNGMGCYISSFLNSRVILNHLAY